MNINIVTSFIISGILLLMLGWMNRGVNYNSQDLALSQQKQEQKMDILEVISWDMPKIGYAADVSLDTLIISADSKHIEFYSNIDNSSDGSVERIRWEFTNQPLTNTPNPNDYKLTRTVNGVTTVIGSGVTNFTLRYYDELGKTTPMSTPLSFSDIQNLCQIEIDLELQSGELLQYSRNTEGRYTTTTWVKRFTPRNLTSNL